MSGAVLRAVRFECSGFTVWCLCWGERNIGVSIRLSWSKQGTENRSPTQEFQHSFGCLSLALLGQFLLRSRCGSCFYWRSFPLRSPEMVSVTPQTGSCCSRTQTSVLHLQLQVRWHVLKLEPLVKPGLYFALSLGGLGISILRTCL